MVVGRKNKNNLKISYFKIYIYIHTHKSSRQSFETNFLQENVLILYYGDQSLVMTDNPQNSDKNQGKKKINRFIEKKM